MDTAEEKTLERVTEVCLLAGKIMMQNGGETYRVEDTMMRIAAAYGMRDSHSFVTPTGLLFAVNGSSPATRLIRISQRSTDLNKVTLVNDISRRISRGELTPDEAHRLLRQAEASEAAYRPLLQAVAAALASGCFLLMFQGRLADFIPAVLAGGLGFAALIWFQKLVPVKLFAEFVASVAVGALSVLLVQTGYGHELDRIIIGSVMPLVPGLLLTNAVRDLIAGHLVSGLSKGAEAFLTAFAIGTGIAFVLSVGAGAPADAFTGPELPMAGHAAASFIASAAFGVLFQAPRRALIQCGLSGMLGWLLYVLLAERLDAVPSTLAASLLVTVVAQLFARLYRTPVIIFSVAGIIPLVPGGVAYDAMRSVVENRYDESLPLAAKAFMLSGAIAIGLVLSEVVNPLLTKASARYRRK